MLSQSEQFTLWEKNARESMKGMASRDGFQHDAVEQSLVVDWQEIDTMMEMQQLLVLKTHLRHARQISNTS